jgi:uncharacterized lipoprotein YmbA
MKMHAHTPILLVVLMLEASCSVLKPRSDPTQYFVLTGEEHAPRAPASVVIGIDRIDLPEYLRRSEIVTRTEANQLKIADYERWGEPLKDGFSRTLKTDLESRLGAGHVLVAPFDPAHRPAVTVDVDVRRFERVLPDRAVLEATWTLRDATGKGSLMTKEVRLSQPLARDDTRATVAALSQVLAALAAEIADAVLARS